MSTGYALLSYYAQYKSDATLVCHLIKSLYRLKQAPREWFLEFCYVLLQYVFTQANTDWLFLFTYYILETGSNAALIAAVKSHLTLHFKIKDLGALKYFLGLDAARFTKGIHLNQRKYTLDIINDVGFSSAKPSVIPYLFPTHF